MKAKYTRPTAVVCDDERVSRRVAETVLQRGGFRVVASVETALDALDAVLEHLPKVLLLDLYLPGVSGEEIVTPVRRGSPGTTIVICSGYEPNVDAQSGVVVVPKGKKLALELALAGCLHAEADGLVARDAGHGNVEQARTIGPKLVRDRLVGGPSR